MDQNTKEEKMLPLNVMSHIIFFTLSASTLGIIVIWCQK